MPLLRITSSVIFTPRNMCFLSKNFPGIAIFEFSRVSDGRVNLNRLVFRLFQLINSIFRSKILARVMAGANLVYSNVNVWLKLKIFNGPVVYGWRNTPRNRQEQLSVPLDITDYRGGLTTAVLVYEY